MALAIFYKDGVLVLVAGHENGFASVAQLDKDSDSWNFTYHCQAHSQAILSLDVSRDKDYFLTSSADAIIAKHPVPNPRSSTPPEDQVDEEIISPSVAASQGPTAPGNSGAPPPPKSLLSQMLAGNGPEGAPRVGTAPSKSKANRPPVSVCKTPLKATNTKHAGQQSLRLRSDSRIFATGGWDSRVRVYSARTLKEVAVLSWHKQGCYAVAFADVEAGERDPLSAANAPRDEHEDRGGDSGSTIQGMDMVPVSTTVGTAVRNRRVAYSRTAHWLAAGSKDGKVSVWDIF